MLIPYLKKYLNEYGWELSFQDPATPIAERIIDIHNWVFFFLVIILGVVTQFLIILYVKFVTLPVIHWMHPVSTFHKSYDNVIMNMAVQKTKEGWRRRKWLLIRLRRGVKYNFNHSTKIEIIWTLIPSFILVLIAVPSFGLLYAMDDVIDPEVTIKTIGHQWYWSYEYTDYISTIGKISFDSYMLPETELTLGQLRLLEVDNSVVLPVGVYIRINVTAADVLHSWAVPSLGIKIDAVPHRINSGVIFLQRTGIFYGQCSEICGVNHGFMPIVVKSVSVDNYLNWLNSH